MRREHELDDAGIVLVVIALVLMIAVFVSMAGRYAPDRSDGAFLALEPPEPVMGLGTPLLGEDTRVRVNELPQVE